MQKFNSKEELINYNVCDSASLFENKNVMCMESREPGKQKPREKATQKKTKTKIKTKTKTKQNKTKQNKTKKQKQKKKNISWWGPILKKVIDQGCNSIKYDAKWGRFRDKENTSYH